MKGWIALDIDGTMTSHVSQVPKKIVSYLEKLQKSGWRILVVTGRSLHDAKSMISSFNFPFIFSSFNGAFAWEMPEKKELFQHCLNKEDILVIEKKIDLKKTFFAVWGNNYTLYGKKGSFFNERMLFGKKIEYIENFKDHFSDSYPLAKCLGFFDDMVFLKKRLEVLNIEISLVKAPFQERNGILLITKKNIHKGSCIQRILKSHGGSFVIAAGNDNNDLPMFSFADIKIAMEDASSNLLKKADIIAPSAKNNGLIQGLKKALEKYQIG